jgi:aminopeptidase N
LEREHAQVTARLADPATVFDARLVVELRQRADELPLFLNASRLRVASLRVEMFDLEAQEHKARMPELHEAMLEEQVRFEDARAVYQNTVSAWQGARADSRVSSMDANEARAVVRQLQAEASNIGGAVVRRRPQAA